ncbi:MAG: hypothetical protein WCT54_00050 [Patescibacteria group bacterium]|jgi:predicted translin family RNA/ssDNA-binding protein
MKNFNFQAIRKSKLSLEKERRELDAKSDEARRQSKLAIFALQRGEQKRGDQCLADARKLIKVCQMMIRKRPSLSGDSGYKSALEEFVEAALFDAYLKDDLRLPAEAESSPDAALGGLADLAGEIARHSVLMATVKNKKAIEHAHATVVKIVDVLAALDLTGSLRSKFDQTKQHLRKIEDLRYDLSR